MKIKNPTGKVLVPTQQLCQRCRNITNITKQRQRSVSYTEKTTKKLVVPKIDAEYIMQELIKAERQRRRQVKKEDKPHFDPKEYNIDKEVE